VNFLEKFLDDLRLDHLNGKITLREALSTAFELGLKGND